MPSFLLKRLLATIPTLFGVLVITFAIVRLTPGDPARLIVGERATEEELTRVRQELGLDRPMTVQFARYVTNLTVKRDIGRSFRTGAPVIDDLKKYFPATVELTLFALGVAIILGVGGAALCSLSRSRWPGRVAAVVSQIGVCVPIFWLGLVAILLVGVALRWLPFDGRMDVRLDLEPVTGFYLLDSLIRGNGTALADAFRHLILPGLTLSLVPLSFLFHVTQLELGNALEMDYSRTAKAKGLSRAHIVLKHALKPASIPVLTITGTQFGYLLGGAVLTESIFQWPGLGRYVVDSVAARDFPAIQGSILLMACAFVLVNLAVDVGYGLLDPRVRH